MSFNQGYNSNGARSKVTAETVPVHQPQKGPGWKNPFSSPAKDRQKPDLPVGRRLQQHVQIILVGETGVGKTETIRHLIGHNRDLKNLGLKASNLCSETRETVEYILTSEGKRKMSNYAHSVSLGIVDTPGLGDTAGREQDARNLASIQTFITEKNGGNTPNLVMLLLRADGNRDIGPDSKLANCIRVFLKPGANRMGLTQSGKNVIIVMTHALNISQHDDKWSKMAKEKIITVKNFVYQQTGWNIPVVLLENDPPKSRMKRQGDWTVLPNKQPQPKNLFDVITAVLKQRQDSQCQFVINSYFARSHKDSAVTISKGPFVSASMDGLRTSQESSFFQLLSDNYPKELDHIQGQSSTNNTATHNAEPDDLTKYSAYDQDQRYEDNHSVQTFKTAGSTVKEVTEGMLIGKGYTVKGDGEIFDCQMFDEQMISDKVQRLTCSRTEWRPLESFNRIGIFRNRNLNSGHFSSFSSKEVCYTDSKVLKVALLKIVPSEDLKAIWTEKAYLSSGFLGDLEKLPTKYDEKTKKKFTKFFKNRGQAFVSKGYYGGEIRLKIPGRYYGVEDDSSGGEVPINCLPFKAQMQLDSRNMLKDLSVIVTFRGGSHAYHHYRCQEDQDKWQRSVSEAPDEIIMDVESDITFYHEFVKELSWMDKIERKKKAMALEEAFVDHYTPGRKDIAKASTWFGLKKYLPSIWK